MDDQKGEVDRSEQLKEEVRKALNKEPHQIPSDHLRPDEGPSIITLNKEIDNMVTDAKLVQDIEKDWIEVQKVFTGADPQMMNFREKYETVFNALKESFENEVKQMKKCKENNALLVVDIAKTISTQKSAQDYSDGILIVKTSIQNNMTLIDKARQREQDIKEKIKNVKDEISDMNRQAEKGIHDIQVESERTIAELTRQKNELVLTQEKLMTKLAEYRTKTDYANKEKISQEEDNFKNVTEINNTKDEIAEINLDIAKKEAKKKSMETDMDMTKKLIDDVSEEFNKKKTQVNENVKQIEILKAAVVAKNKEKERMHEQVHTKKSQHKATEKEKEKQQELLEHLRKYIEDQTIELNRRTQEYNELEIALAKAKKEHSIYNSKTNQIGIKKKESENEKRFLENEVKIIQEHLEDKIKQEKMVEEEIDKVFKQREEVAREIKVAEKEEHEKEYELIELTNHLRKLENQVRGYKAEAQKLNKIISLLENEQEKYGVEASQAHAKYFQTLEELKIKNTLINELQKKNNELSDKLRHQQNLYEAVRNDRNIYSKNLLKAQEEIGELTKKYTRMSHQVDQLKDELKLKDSALVRQDHEFQNIVKENEDTKKKKANIKAQIKTREDIIKNQEEQISRLKYIISEAMAEKNRQLKDYDMVVNERDILGSQLIKRNQELAELYEKIKIAQSNLAKGESYFREKNNEFEQAKNSLAQLRKELDLSKEQTESIEDLRQEINALQKDLLNQKTRTRALADELEIKMNVHRWRKVEATDQENYERILKIQTLQRRLIAKTEEVNEKDQLIKEKEKLYMELKNILARQPGEEVQQQLATYKENLKEKSAQMKKMLEELKLAQDQVNLYKFEIDKLKETLGSHKKEYFKRRAEEDKLKSGNGMGYGSMHSQLAIPYAYTGTSGYAVDGGLVIGGQGSSGN